MALKEEALLGITEQNLAEKAAQTKKEKPVPRREDSLRMLERKYSKDRAKPTDVKEVCSPLLDICLVSLTNC